MPYHGIMNSHVISQDFDEYGRKEGIPPGIYGLVSLVMLFSHSLNS